VTISAEIIADSVGPAGIRLVTMQLRYPRFIHAEFMTHRVFSRNASSSRAIPTKRLIEDVNENPARPSSWGANQKGMQAGRELTGIEAQRAESLWNFAKNCAVQVARGFDTAGVHKQAVNRILEPFAHINVVVSSTQWDNFFELRMHPDAQPEIQELATRMHEAMSASRPQLLEPGVWHLPYIYDEEHNEADTTQLIKASVARCARVSYKTHEGLPSSIGKDLELYERLVGSVPMHASPAEHQATPDFLRMSIHSPQPFWSAGPEMHGNFNGWVQLRKMLEIDGDIDV
jgi:thymidylate synthase ThyX